MNRYSFEAYQEPTTGKCYVRVRRNAELIEIHRFDTPEWAVIFKRACEALDRARYSPFITGRLTLSNDYGSCISTDSYTREEVDALLQRITSLEHWLEPLRNKVRRFFDLLMWGERGRFSKT